VGDFITLSKADTAGETAAAGTTASDSGNDDKNDLEINMESDSTAPVLTVSKYEITAVILSPLDISNTGGGLSSVSFSSNSSDYMMYATADCIESGIYNAIYITIDGASELNCYSNEYQKLVDNVTATIKSTIQKNRQQQGTMNRSRRKA
jgi:putative ABC transport system permease protein